MVGEGEAWAGYCVSEPRLSSFCQAKAPWSQRLSHSKVMFAVKDTLNYGGSLGSLKGGRERDQTMDTVTSLRL